MLGCDENWWVMWDVWLKDRTTIVGKTGVYIEL